MSKIKFSPDLFIEKAELDRFKKFIDDDGFRSFLLENTVKYGLINNAINGSFDNGYIYETAGLTIANNEIKAINKDGNLIYKPTETSIAVPGDNNYYWVRITHQFSNQELGTWSLDNSGNLTCTTLNGELLTIGRSQPNFPSRVTFLNATNNILEYDILDIIDNNNAVLQGDFVAETGLKLTMVGTFTPGVVPQVADKYIFQYDSCLFELVAETTNNTPPTFNQDYQFYLARVKSDGVNLSIEDKRTEFWETSDKYLFKNLTQLPNTCFGIENIRFDNVNAAKDKNIVQVAWGLRSNSWTFNSKLNQVTFLTVEGGRFKPADVSLFVDGDFDGWRLYLENGSYYRIKTSSLIGSQINLVLDNGSDPTFTIVGQTLLIVPDAEEIEIIFRANPTDSTTLPDARFVFPINEFFGKCNALVYKESGTLYNVKYRYKHIRNYSPEFIPLDDTVGYYNESQFDEDGVIIVSPTRTTYTTSPTNGWLSLQFDANSIKAFKNKIDLGDALGVETKTLSNATPLIELTVGGDKQYQYFSGSTFTLTGDMFINIKDIQIDSSACKNGNRFFIQVKQIVNVGNFKLRIVEDYVNPTTYTLLKEFSNTDSLFLSESEEGIFITASYDGTKWIVNNTNEANRYYEESVHVNGGLSDLAIANGVEQTILTLPASKVATDKMHFNFSVSHTPSSSGNSTNTWRIKKNGTQIYSAADQNNATGLSQIITLTYSYSGPVAIGDIFTLTIECTAGFTPVTTIQDRNFMMFTLRGKI